MRIADWYVRGHAGGSPKVSVAMITYQHEAFIRDAIESVLMQEVDFTVELVIGEDCSPDRTREIILQYQETYPNLIRLNDYDKNVGSARNAIMTIGRCRGEYIALLDGDDYWTSPDKLRRQVSLMDSRPELSMCFHAINRERDGEIVKTVVRPPGRKPVYYLEDLSQWINIATSAMLYRRSALPVFPSWFTSVGQGDWAMQFLLAEKGDIAYIPDVMGAHRLHDTNIWSGRRRPKSEVLSELIKEVNQFRIHLGDERARPFELSQRRRYYELIHAYLDEGKVEEARGILQAGGRRGYDPRVDLLEPWLSLLHIKAPRLYKWLRLDAVHLNRLIHRFRGRFVRPLLDRLMPRTAAARRK